MWLWKRKKRSSSNPTTVYSVTKNRKNTSLKITTERFYEKLQNPDNDKRGDWFSGSISFQENRSNPKHKNYYSIQSPSGIQWTRQWQCSQSEMEEHIKNNAIYFGTAPTYQSVPRLKIFPPVYIDIIPPNIIENVGTTRSASRELSQIFDGILVFDFPKSFDSFAISFGILCDGDWVLDFFAGSGTTGQAVYECQKKELIVVLFSFKKKRH